MTATEVEDEEPVEDINDRKTYVITELQHLLGTDWTPSLANRLGYHDPDSMAIALRRWNRPDLARRLERAYWDGNASDHARTQMDRRHGAAW